MTVLTPPPPTTARPALLIPLRLLLIVLGLIAWFYTQHLISLRPFPSGMGGGIADGLHSLLAVPHDFLLANPRYANLLLIISSAIIDLLALFLLGSSLFGPTIRPFLGLLILFALRQLCQALCALPPPDHMIWNHPGFPSLLVTYGVSNDLFFSGHTAIAVFAATELTRLNKKLLPLAIFIALFEATTVLILRAHWTMDVFTGAITALWVAQITKSLAPKGDRQLNKLLNPKPQP